jgi:hypothetical protein
MKTTEVWFTRLLLPEILTLLSRIGPEGMSATFALD